ncbi:3'-5' exonuclease [Candidatus Pacearchaeota archaeon]|nr:3'-5' exonuclease [Candidatus Pacearchaeota archaeon]
MIVVDVETTGLSPWKNSIVSIGAVEFENPKNRFYAECNVWEGAEINQEALNVNGFEEYEIINNPDKLSTKETIQKFIFWTEKIKDKTLAGQNPFFDRDFLSASAKRFEIEWTLGRRIVDLHSLCYAHHLKIGKGVPLVGDKTDLNNDKILEYVGLPSEPKPHKALTGALMECEAFSRLIYGKNLIEEFSKYEVPEFLR